MNIYRFSVFPPLLTVGNICGLWLLQVFLKNLVICIQKYEGTSHSFSVMSPSVQLRPGLSRRLPPTVCSETLNRKSVQPPTRLSQLEKFLEPMADLRGAQGGHHLCHAGAVLQVRGETEGQGSVK